MDRDATLNGLRDALVRQWEVAEGTEPQRDLLLAALAERVQELFDRDSDRLTSAMYTLDIDEERFGAAMGLTNSDAQALAVAELILEREYQKMESRLRYAAMKPEDVSGEGKTPQVDGAESRLSSD